MTTAKVHISHSTARLVGALLLDASARGADDQQTEGTIQMVTGTLYNAEADDASQIHPVDRQQIHMVRQQVDQANAWIDQHGALPKFYVAAGRVPAGWPTHGTWQRAVWEVVNSARTDS